MSHIRRFQGESLDVNFSDVETHGSRVRGAINDQIIFLIACTEDDTVPGILTAGFVCSRYKQFSALLKHNALLGENHLRFARFIQLSESKAIQPGLFDDHA